MADLIVTLPKVVADPNVIRRELPPPGTAQYPKRPLVM
jgi:hypothetical protein